jgi:hypothetical protein
MPVHIIIPMLFAFILVGFVRDRQFDAVTWSSISHLLQSSSWPILLRSDGAVGNLKGKLTRWRIYLISLCVTLTTICLVVANFLTPKPLKEVIQASSGSHVADFQYAAGESFDVWYCNSALLKKQTLHSTAKRLFPARQDLYEDSADGFSIWIVQIPSMTILESAINTSTIRL